jgi:hypothetical protein
MDIDGDVQYDEQLKMSKVGQQKNKL